MLFPYLVYIAHFKKIHIGKLFAYGKSLLMEKSKAEKTPWEKKRKKTGLKKEERVPLMKA